MTSRASTSLAPGTCRIRTASLDGGPGTRAPDPRVTDWLRAYGPRAGRLVSVCTGAILLAEAGLLDGRRATIHWAYSAELASDHPAVTVDPDPIYVCDGPVFTAAGVSSGIDMGLTLLGRIAGDEHAQAVQLLTEYDPQPPYDAGSPQKAPAHLVERFRASSRFILT